MASYRRDYYEANRDKILERQKAWYRKNKTNPSRTKMTAEERRMAKNECEARRRDRLRNRQNEQAQELELIDPMPKMAKGINGIKELLSGKA